ncbi:unnamed protein product, partial [marine sediment metagenome]
EYVPLCASSDVNSHVCAAPGGNGTQGSPFQYIQDGVNDAFPGDTIYVFNGTYSECVMIKYPLKQLDLIGESRENVIIDGGGSGDVVHVSADNV